MFWSFILAPSFALAQAAPAAGEQPSLLMSLVPFIFIFAIMYFLIIRPQGKRQREHLKFVSELKRGDEVITASGILGRIEGMTEQFVTLEVADGVRLKILRNQVAASSKTLTENKKG